jgi:hypothetical protein
MTTPPFTGAGHPDAPHAPLVDPRAARTLPLWYFFLAHLCMAVAGEAIAAQPASLLGPWYQGHTLAIVHFVTLGWITGSILGAFYAFAPMALRITVTVTRWDGAAFLLYAVGATGVASHFWLEEPLGMAQSAGLTLVALAFVLGRLWRSLRSSPLPPAALLAVRFAVLNFALAAAFGAGLAANRLWHFLPTSVLANVAAHAHLAALGWGAMLLLAFGQRLLPMLLPAAVPPADRGAQLAVLFEIGTLGLTASLLFSGPVADLGVALFAALTALALLGALGGVLWMVRHPRPRPPALARPDWGLWHVRGALVCLLGAIAVGLSLAWTPADDDRVRWVPIYAVLGLLGFLGQAIVGVSARLLPVFAWMRAFGGVVWPSPPPPPHALVLRELQPWCWASWTAALVALVVGLLRADAGWVRAGGYLLLLATVFDTLALGWLALRLRTARRARRPLRPDAAA